MLLRDGRARFAFGIAALGAGLWVGCSSPQPTVEKAKADTQDMRPGKDDKALVADPTIPDDGESPEEVRRNRARAIYLIGLECFNRREYDTALIEFQRALEVEPQFHRAYFKQGLCYYYKQRYEYEIASYHKCLEIAPNYMPALHNLANALFATDRLEEAVKCYLRILDLDPKHPVALYNLGIAYFELGKKEQAIEVLERFIEIYPKDPLVPKARSIIERAQGK